MKTQGYTKVSDVLIDSWLTDLTEAELKTLLIIIRQTTGWNKPRDRISHSQFIKKTGLSQRSITSAIESLSHRNFIHITNPIGTELTAQERRYREYIYYTPTDFTNAKSTITNAKSSSIQRQNLPVTIYNNNKQQETDMSSSETPPQHLKKQSDQERLNCIEQRKKNISCSCFRCV